MATQRTCFLFVALAALMFVITLVGCSVQGANNEFHFDAATLKDTALWNKVNASPYVQNTVVSTSCAAVTQPDPNPHQGSFITVYVNNPGKATMFTKEVKRFPEGSVIVKEKIDRKSEDNKPLLYTIMRKRETGYNPKVGDWEFAVVGPNGKEIQAIGKIEKCQSCHLGKSDSDFVFRDYMKF